MSIFYAMRATCAVCGAEFQGEIVASVNADRRPDLREDILRERFQAVPCPDCGVQVRLPPNLVYLDCGRGQWIMCCPAERSAEWRDFEAIARSVFEGAFGQEAPAIAQEIGRDLLPRLTFGWPALREKLQCCEYGLDDVTLELLKAAIVRDIPKPPLTDATELRLESVEDDVLVMCWKTIGSETPVAALRCPRDRYAAIDPLGACWKPLRDELNAGPFVDLERFLVADLGAPI